MNKSTRRPCEQSLRKRRHRASQRHAPDVGCLGRRRRREGPTEICPSMPARVSCPQWVRATATRTGRSVHIRRCSKKTSVSGASGLEALGHWTRAGGAPAGVAPCAGKEASTVLGDGSLSESMRHGAPMHGIISLSCNLLTCATRAGFVSNLPALHTYILGSYPSLKRAGRF